MSIFEKLKDNVPTTSKGKSVKKDEPDEEEFKEDLSPVSEPEGTTSFNRKNVIIAITAIGLIFTLAFIYGISSASNGQKNKKNAEVETAATAQHLKDVPSSYSDDKNRQYNKNQDKDKDKNKNKIERPRDNDDDRRESRSYTPSYTPIPRSSYAPSYTPIPHVSAPSAPTRNVNSSSGGMTMEQKIAAEKAKEKMAANQSQISFGLKEEQ